MEIRGNYGSLIKGVDAKVKEIFDEAGSMYEIVLPGFINKKIEDGAQRKESGLSPAGKLTKRSEGDSYEVGRRYKTYDTNYVHATYSKKLEVSFEMIQDRDFDVVFDEVRTLSIAAKRWVQQGMFQPFINGFSTSTTKNGFDVTLYGDGVPLCSIQHPRADGGATQSNASSTGITLTDANLETGRVALLEQLLDDGSPVAVMGRIWLVVPTALQKTAKVITGSEKRSDTANNDLNIYNDESFGVLSTHYLGAIHGGSDTAWYLAIEGTNKIKYVERLLPMVWTRKNDRNGLDTMIDVRASFGHSHWIGVWGSKGDSSAYSS